MYNPAHGGPVIGGNPVKKNVGNEEQAQHIDPMIQHLEHGSLHSRFTHGKQSGSDQAHVGNGRISDQPLYITLPAGDNSGVYNPNDGKYANALNPSTTHL